MSGPSGARERTPASRTELATWQRFLRADSHILRESPGLLYQQAANQPESSAPSRQAAARLAAGKVTSPWLRWVNKPRSPDPCLLTVGGEGTKTSCGAFLPGGRRILAAAGSELQVWDFESGVLERTIPGRVGSAGRCFRAPDGKTVGFVGSQGLVVFDCTDLSELFWVAEESPGGRWVFSPDGRRAACACQCPARFKLWDLDGRRLVLEKTGETNPRNPVSFCAGGSRVVVHWQKGLELIDAASGSQVAAIEGDSYAAEDRLIASMTAGPSPALTLWDPLTGEKLRPIPADRPVHRLSIAPGGKRILADVILDEVLDKIIWGHYLWDAESGNLVATLPSGYGAHVSALLDRQAGTVEPVSLPGHSFWPDGSRLATWPPFSTGITVWDPDAGERLRDLAPHPAWVQSCSVSPSGGCLTVVCQDGSLVVWDGRDLSRRGTLRGSARQVLDLFYSPDERHLASAAADGSLKIWEIPASSESEGSTHEGRVTACAFPARGDRLLSAALDGILMLRNPESGEAIARLNPRQGGILAAALPPAGDEAAFIAGDPYANVHLWNARTGEVRSLGDIGHGEQGGRCRFTADGRHLVAVGGSRHGISVLTSQISIWRTDNWSKVFSSGYGAPLARFDLTTDGRWALFNLRDGTFLLWDFRAGPGAAMRETKGVRAFAVHPSGQLALLTRAGSGAQIMQLETQEVWGTPLPSESMAGWRAFSRDGMMTASWPCKIGRINPHSLNLEFAWEAPAEYFLKFSEDGDTVVTCTGTEAVVLRRTDDGAQICRYYPRGAFNQIDFAPGDRKLAVGTMLGEVHLLTVEGLTAKRRPAAMRAPSVRGAGGRSSNRSAKRIGLNDPCPCGSGKKYKKCCGAPK